MSALRARLQGSPVGGCRPSPFRSPVCAWSPSRPMHVCIRSSASSSSSLTTEFPVSEEPLTPQPTMPPASTPSEQPAAVHTQLTAEEEKQKKERLWKAAIKLPMYSVGYIPVLVGGAAVFYLQGVAPVAELFGFAVASILVIAWLNLSNDVFDADTGVDAAGAKPESLVNLLGNRTALGWAALLLLVAGTSILGTLITRTGDMRPAALLAFSIACGYVYQGPPFRLSYKGLGEPLCFLAFGPSATTAFYLAMSSQPAAKTAAAAGGTLGLASIAAWVHPTVWVAALLVGLTTTIILLTSHFHQIESDKAAGKHSPLVRLGIERGLRVLQAGVSITYMIVAAAACVGLLPMAVLPAVLGSLPAARELLSFAAHNYRIPARIAPLKRYSCMWHIAFGCCLSLGLLAARALHS